MVVLVAQRKRPIVNHFACKGRLSGRPGNSSAPARGVAADGTAPDWLPFRLPLKTFLAGLLQADGEGRRRQGPWSVCTARATPPWSHLHAGLGVAPFRIGLQG